MAAVWGERLSSPVPSSRVPVLPICDSRCRFRYCDRPLSGVKEVKQAWQESFDSLRRLRAVFAEMEKTNHPNLPVVRQMMQKAETAHECLTNEILTGGRIDAAEFRAFLSVKE